MRVELIKKYFLHTMAAKKKAAKKAKKAKKRK